MTSYTVDTIIDKIQRPVAQRLSGLLKLHNLEKLPDQVLLVAYKKEKILELRYKAEQKWKLFKQYPLTAYSGKLGPKLNEGDKQIPEGIYNIEYLNPNSSFYLSMKINFPNTFDLTQAKKENRNNPGSDIFIHGKNRSIGCLAIGDQAVEEVFYVASQRRQNTIPVWIFPTNDLSTNWVQLAQIKPLWLGTLYTELKNKLKTLD